MGLALTMGRFDRGPSWGRYRRPISAVLGAVLLIWLLTANHSYIPEPSRAVAPVLETDRSRQPPVNGKAEMSPNEKWTQQNSSPSIDEKQNYGKHDVSVQHKGTHKGTVESIDPDKGDFHTSPPETEDTIICPDNVAVIMETDPRRVKNFVPIILHFASILGDNWPIVLVTLEENWVVPDSPAFRRLFDAERIQTLFLPKGTEFPSHHSVSVFLTAPWLWEQVECTNRVLMFQSDSILCSKSNLTIEDFLEYDLIGAPIAKQFGHGFNGGLSLRNPKLALSITREFSEKFKEMSGSGQAEIPNELKFEDQWFYMRMKERGAKLPTPDVAKTFAVETVFYDKPLGYHQPARWQKDNMKNITEWCPEVGMLMAQRFPG